MDVREGGEPATPTSRRKRFWASLKNSAKRRFRSRSREKKRIDSTSSRGGQDGGAPVQPRWSSTQDMTSSKGHQHQAINGSLDQGSMGSAAGAHEDAGFFDSLDNAASTQAQDDFVQMRSASGRAAPPRWTLGATSRFEEHGPPSLLDRGRSEDKESEQDSGIAFIDQSVSGFDF